MLYQLNKVLMASALTVKFQIKDNVRLNPGIGGTLKSHRQLQQGINKFDALLSLNGMLPHQG